jgi:hypothetical protein
MNQPEVYGTFIKRDQHLFRTSAYIQWGQSSKSIGSCLMLNPGAANLERENKHLYNGFHSRIAATPMDTYWLGYKQ